MIQSLRAAVSFANRYAALARELAGRADAPLRRAELLEIARVCERVPEHPARTFREAIQCVYFIHLVSQIESGGNSISLGRIDRILFPYYEADLAAGRITPEQARELLALLFVKTNEIWNVLEEAFIPGGEGTEGKTTQNVTVGGVDDRGEDATNDLSTIGLDAFADVRTGAANFGVRLSAGTRNPSSGRPRYAKDAVPLHFFNDEAIVPALVRAGHTWRTPGTTGSWGAWSPMPRESPSAPPSPSSSTGSSAWSSPSPTASTTSSATSPASRRGSGVLHRLRRLWSAYDRQFTHFLGQMVKGMAVLDRAVAELVPSPFASAMIDGPLEKGLDLTRGGPSTTPRGCSS